VGKIEEVIRQEISRLAKKTTKGNLESLGTKLIELRRTVSSLTRRVSVLEEKLSTHQNNQTAHKTRLRAPEEQVRSARFTPLLIKKLRKRLGITQDDLALLLDISKGAIVSWESGRTKPREAHKESLVALRKLGRRDIKKLLVEKGKSVKKRKRRKKKRSKAK
jgi:DNA-binding transcriptional regulator YiaG